MLLLSFYLINFFSWKLLLFFHVPGCSGMLWNVPECSMFRVLSTSLFCIQLIIWYILYRKARIYFFSLLKHFFGTIWGWIDAVPLREGQALTHSLKVQPDLWNSHRSIVSLTAFDYWGRKQSERIRHNFRMRESVGLGFRWCSKWWENSGFKC